jgi:2-iminobutanoate/2-iminopropanoate deaminase
MPDVLLRALIGFAVLVASAVAAYAADEAPATPSPELEFHALPAGPLAHLPFSEAVRVDHMLYLSGELGTDAHGKLVAGGIKPETKQMMDNIGRKLVAHGSSFDHVVTCTVALADIAEWPAFNEIYRGYFRKRFPARMAYATSGLALGARIELQCTAVIGAKD